MADFKLIYNPKKFDRKINKAKVVDMYARREGDDPKGKLLEKPAVYTIKVNELKKFRADIADYLLGKFGFLREIEARDVDKALEEMKEKKYKCKLCDFETDTPIALKGHMRSHKLSEEAQKILAEIPEAKPEAYVIGAEHSGSGQTEFVAPEQAEGIPFTDTDDPRGKGATDREGVEWYGKGLQQVRRRGTPGQQRVRRPAFQL